MIIGGILTSFVIFLCEITQKYVKDGNRNSKTRKPFGQQVGFQKNGPQNGPKNGQKIRPPVVTLVGPSNRSVKSVAVSP